jgi:hypothetical protein
LNEITTASPGFESSTAVWEPEQGIHGVRSQTSQDGPPAKRGRAGAIGCQVAKVPPRATYVVLDRQRRDREARQQQRSEGPHLQQPARPFPPSIYIDKNRHDIGESQSDHPTPLGEKPARSPSAAPHGSSSHRASVLPSPPRSWPEPPPRRGRPQPRSPGGAGRHYTHGYYFRVAVPRQLGAQQLNHRSHLRTAAATPAPTGTLGSV